MKIYSDLENQYTLIDYHPTHSQLLIRSMKNKYRDYNIDIFIKSIYFLSFPVRMEGIEISVIVDPKMIDTLKNRYKLDINYRKIFSIKDSNGNEYLINASVFGVYHNNFEILESYLESNPYVDPGKCSLWYDGKML